MWKKLFSSLGIGMAVFCLVLASSAGAAAPKPFVFGMLLVGPFNDHGWSQGHGGRAGKGGL